MAVILSGKELSDKLTQEQKARVEELKNRAFTRPGCGAGGEDPASHIYVRNKGIACETIGIHSETVRLPAETRQEQLEDTIDQLNRDSKISGILVQLPLPKHLNEEAALAKILPEKDVDGFHLMNAGKLFTGQEGWCPARPRASFTC